MSDSITAELAAIAHALHRVELRWGDALDGRTIHVRTDCAPLLRLLSEAGEVSQRWRTRSPGVVPALARIRAVVARRRLSLDAKHVRAHQPRESSTEAWLNDSVDRLARAAKPAIRALRDGEVRHGVRSRGRRDPSFGARWDDTRGWVEVDLGPSADVRDAAHARAQSRTSP